MLSHQLFTTSPTCCQVLKDVLTIFRTHWQPLVAIALFQFLSFIGAFLVLGIVTMILFANVIAQIMESLPDGSYSGYGTRHLLDYTVGASGASRLLDQVDYYNFAAEYYEARAAARVSIFAFGLQLLAMYLLWAIVLSLVDSIYKGAMTHAIADIYAGNSPTLKGSIGVGWAHKWKIYLFSLLQAGIFTAALFVTIGIPMSFGIVDLIVDHPVGAMVVGLVVFFIVMILVGMLMLGAIPSIVVEGKSPIEAIVRSWKLCKSHVCFIFCNWLGFQVVMICLMVVIDLILNELPAALKVLGHLVVNVVSMTIGPILVFVLYMSVRIRSENLIQEKFTRELNNNVPVANDAVAAVSYKYQKPPEQAEASIV
jgi:hypothetical protein